WSPASEPTPPLAAQALPVAQTSRRAECRLGASVTGDLSVGPLNDHGRLAVSNGLYSLADSPTQNITVSHLCLALHRTSSCKQSPSYARCSTGPRPVNCPPLVGHHQPTSSPSVSFFLLPFSLLLRRESDFFKKDQLFVILEFDFGGVDLENSNGTFASLRVAKSILHQVTAALAVAEQELHFEHRDLHWGNVLVKTTKQKTGSFLLNGTAHSVETKGVLVHIIDYSLSRLEIDDLTVSCDISNDEDLFLGQGDYQFEVYRLMRKENGNNWSDYHPRTNVLWLHYLCSKLLSMKYRGTGGRSAKDMREELTGFYDNVLQYSSATEALQNCPMFQ
ncbi:serine/threonine-protein kinase haspin, partial [Acanthochromis polyacanthus]|uniref:serine/threonine-protein kinase haspin n=1 Tax=Acanthochromis polyacanthus TaxID=80966 RepID=UPI00223466C7